MLKKKFFAIVAFCVIFLSSCTDNNPTNFFEANSSSETPLSSSATVESSSSLDILSSSVEIESSSSELSSSSTPISYGTLTDERDGQVYKTVKIGNQTWMAENLNYAYLKPFKDQDSSSWCNNNDPENCTKYGRLYTWAAAMDSTADFEQLYEEDDSERDYLSYSPTGICPQNWHIPSINDWDSLNTIDLRSSEGWDDGVNSSDVLGFKMLPAEIIGKRACFWIPKQTSHRLYEATNSFELAYAIFFGGGRYSEYIDVRKNSYACSVRCIKDNESAE